MYGNHTCFSFAQIPRVSGSALIDPLIRASKSSSKKTCTNVIHKLFSCALLSKSLLTTYLSMSVVHILCLVSTSFCRYLQELLRDWKAMPSRKSFPAFFLQHAASLSLLIAVGLDPFLLVF